MAATLPAREAAPSARLGSARIGGRELALLALGAALIAVVMHWPLILHLGTDVPRDTGDPLSQAWQVAWGGHALRTQPRDYWQANQFWPLPNSLAFSDALVGYAPAGLIGDGRRAAIARYDVLFLFAYALAFAGAYLLGRELRLRPLAAAVAGAAFAYAPWRLEQDGHLHVLSSGGIPLVLFLLVRGYRRGAPGLVIAGWLIGAWQIAISFSTGLLLTYLLLLIGLLASARWWRTGRPVPSRNLVWATLAGVLAMSLTAVVLARPYLQVLHDHPEAKRSTHAVAAFSGPVWELLVAPEENLIWGPITHGLRARLNAIPEQTLFPGLVILALAAAGLGAAPWPRRLRVGLGLAVLGSAVLALGFTPGAGRWAMPYWYLYELAPGWSAIRVPGRMMILLTLALALLAGAGAHRVLAWAERRRGRAEPSVGEAGVGEPRVGRKGVALGLALVALVLLEGSGWDLDGIKPKGPAHPVVPEPPSGQATAAAPQLHLPAEPDDNRRYLIWSTDGFPRMVNGRSSFMPRQFAAVLTRVRSFPDRGSIAFLRRLGVRTVILHRDRLAGSPWAAWERRPVGALGLRREVRGGVVLYDLGPAR